MKEEYGIELKLILDKFKEKITRIKDTFSGIKDQEVDVKVDTAQLEYLRYKIKEVSDLLKENQRKPFMSYEEMLKAEIELDKLNNEYEKLIDNEEEAGNKGNQSFNNLSKGIDKTISKIKKFAFSLFSIRGIYSLLSRASSAYVSQDVELANKLQAVWIGLGAILEPIISAIANTLIKAVKYINIFIKALTGVDLLAKAMSKSLAKTNGAAKALSKTLAGFDDLNNIDTNSDVSNSGIDTNWADAFNDVEIDSDVAKTIEDIGTRIKETWQWVTDNWQVVVLAIGGISLAFIGLKFALNKLKGKDVATGFSDLLSSLGKATQAIAILGGIALVINQITGLIKEFSESGLSLGDVAILLGTVLGELAVAFVAIAAATKLMDWTGVAGALVILGGLALILNQVTKLLELFSKTGMSAGDVAQILGVILGEVVIAMTAMALVAKLLCSDPLTLLGLIALVASISITLIVIAETIPKLLEAVSKFMRDIAPVLIVLIDKINECINKTIRALGEVLPPIIRSLGELFNTIFTGIGNVVTSIGNTVSKIINSVGNVITSVFKGIRDVIKQIGDTITQVAYTIIWFINNLGPAINNFVDNTIRAVTKLVNFVISAVEYLVNRLVDGINSVASVLNNIPGVNIGRKSYVYIPRFVPSYDVGTNYVPEDQLAYIHKGEAVIPKKFNSQEYFGGSDNETKSLLQEIKDAIHEIEINPYTTIKDVGQASEGYFRDKERRSGKKVFA